MGRLDLAIEQTVLRSLKRLKPRPRRVLLAVSGGADSMVMAEIIWKWRAGLDVSLQVAHVHHGTATNSRQRAFRNRAQKFVRQWAEARGLGFFTNDAASATSGKNELEWREFRERKLNEWAAESGSDAIAFAHQLDDLLETRMIRLIRGSGAQGLRAMCVLRRGKLRPLLALSAREIREYAAWRELKWLEDPSNAEADRLRNWLRRDWLPELEAHRPGALRALARSLEAMAPRSQDFQLAPYVGLRREVFAVHSEPKQRALLAAYLKEMGLKGYAQTHIDEILKRLSTVRRQHDFEMLGLRFTISPEFLWASRV